MNFTVLTTTLNNFITAFSAGFARLLPIIQYLLYALAGIELILFGLWWALGGNDQIVAAFKKLLFLTFWLWLVTQFPALSSAFRDSLIDAGLIAGGAPGNHALLLDPSRIAGYGVTATGPLAHEVMSSSILSDPASAILYALSYLLIMLCFLALAIQVFLAVLEFYLFAAVVGVLLPFGLLGPTKFLAEKGIGAVIASGIKLMVLAFILAVTDTTMASSLRFTTTPVALDEIMAVLLTAAAITFLAISAPRMAMGLLAGSPSLEFGHAASAAARGAAHLAGAAQQIKTATLTAATAGGAAVLGGARLAGMAYGGAQRGATGGSIGGPSNLAIAGGAARGASASLVQSTIRGAGRALAPITDAIAGQFRAGARSTEARATSWNVEHDKPNWWDRPQPPPKTPPSDQG